MRRTQRFPRSFPYSALTACTGLCLLVCCLVALVAMLLLGQLRGGATLAFVSLTDATSKSGGLSFAAGPRLNGGAQNMDGTEIYLIDTATRLVLNRTGHPAQDRDPRWSPDGRWMAFVSNRDSGGVIPINGVLSTWQLYLMRHDGRDLRRITPPGTRISAPPVWSPDGRKLVYQSRVDNTQGLFVVEVAPDGTVSAPLALTPPDVTDTDAVWSPDGQKIAFRRSHNPWLTLMVHNLATGAAIALTDGTLNGQNLAWSADGRYISFINSTLQGDQVVVVEASSAAPIPMPTVAGAIWSVSWLRERSTLALGVEHVEDGVSILLYDLDQGNSMRMVAVQQPYQAPASLVWSPTTRTLLVDGSGLHLIETGDGSQHTLYGGGRWMVWQPIWSPDGAQVAFERDRRLTLATLETAGAAGHDLWTLPDFLVFDPPTWRPGD